MEPGGAQVASPRCLILRPVSIVIIKLYNGIQKIQLFGVDFFHRSSIYPWLSTTLDSFRISRPHEVSFVSTGGRLRYRDFAIILSHCIHQAISGAPSPEKAMEDAARLLRQPPEDVTARCLPPRDTELLPVTGCEPPTRANWRLRRQPTVRGR